MPHQLSACREMRVAKLTPKQKNSEQGLFINQKFFIKIWILLWKWE
jgi:hypothetical protein